MFRYIILSVFLVQIQAQFIIMIAMINSYYIKLKHQNKLSMSIKTNIQDKKC